jgi:hypothetical protein
MVILSTYATIIEAEMIKNLLEAQGIKVMLRRGDLYPQIGDMAGAQLLVREINLEKAQDLIDIQ